MASAVSCIRIALLARSHSSPIAPYSPTITWSSFRLPHVKVLVSPKFLCLRSSCLLLPSRVSCSHSETCNSSNDSSTTLTISASSSTPVSSVGVSPSPSVDTIRDAANALEIRVGRILNAWRHPEADSLYVEEVDVGEPEPRTVCSGLVRFVPLEDLQGRNVIVLANLKSRNMRGVKSNGMLLAASDAQHDHVELLSPPEGSIPGGRIWFGLEEEKHDQPEAATPNQVQKRKIWETVQPHLKTTSSCIAVLGMHPMRTSAGVVVCKSLKNANIA